MTPQLHRPTLREVVRYAAPPLGPSFFGAAWAGSTAGPTPPPPAPAAIFGARLRVWLNPRTLSGSDGDEITSLPNLADTGLIASVTGSGGSSPTLSRIRSARALRYSSLRKLSGAFASKLTQPTTTFIVGCADGTHTTTRYLVDGNSATDYNRLYLSATTWPAQMTGSANTAINYASALKNNEPFAMSFLASGLSSQVRKNGSVVVASGSGTRVLGGLTLGCSFTGSAAANAQIGEVCVVTGTITGDEHDAMQAYFAHHYGVGETRAQLMMAGDSNTAGVGSTSGRGFRDAVGAWGWAEKRLGKWVDTVGIRNNAGTRWNSQHRGSSGDVINDLQTNMLGEIGAANQYPPDIMFLMIGTNDARNNGASFTGATTRLQTLLSDIHSANASIKVLVSTILACNPSDTTTAANIATFNAAIPGICATLDAGEVWLKQADMHGAVGAYNGTNFSDSYHLSDAGYALAAAHVQSQVLRWL